MAGAPGAARAPVVVSSHRAPTESARARFVVPRATRVCGVLLRGIGDHQRSARYGAICRVAAHALFASRVPLAFCFCRRLARAIRRQKACRAMAVALSAALRRDGVCATAAFPGDTAPRVAECFPDQ